MKLINSSVSIIEQFPGLEGIYKQCELAGRTAYKSESRITEDSAKKFVDAMIKSNHGAVLEHGTVYLKVSHSSPMYDANYFKSMDVITFYRKNKYSKVKETTPDNFKIDCCITSNLRVLFENDRMSDLQYLCEPTEHHEKRITSKFICSRSIAQEITRHRAMSFLMESQRYCMYSKDKFDGEITFIIPKWVKERIAIIAQSEENEDLREMPYEIAIEDSRVMNDKSIHTWYTNLVMTERDYMELVANGCKAEEARSVLNNDCKTELIMTGFVSDYEHFFDLRSKGTTGKPHPDVKVLADWLLFNFECDGLLHYL